MRASRATKAKRHEEIISQSSKMLRARGIAGTSLIDLMRAVGMTHGGFYRHFSSKESLVAEAMRRMFAERIAAIRELQQAMGVRAALAAYIDDYLTQAHVDHPEVGCPAAAFGADAARQDPAVRAAFLEGTKAFLGLMADGLPGPAAARSAAARELMALVTGAVVMARATADRELSLELLASARVRARQLIEADVRPWRPS